jgi:two-component system OmpR family response regulator
MANTVLIVDDDPSILRFTRQALEAEGFTVDVAQNGSAALQKIRHCLPDVLICDLMMPEMNGDEVVRRIPRGSKPKIIMTSALPCAVEESSQFMSRMSLLAPGVDWWVSKPYNPSEVIRAVKHLIQTQN